MSPKQTYKTYVTLCCERRGWLFPSVAIGVALLCWWLRLVKLLDIL